MEYSYIIIREDEAEPSPIITVLGVCDAPDDANELCAALDQDADIRVVALPKGTALSWSPQNDGNAAIIDETATLLSSWDIGDKPLAQSDEEEDWEDDEDETEQYKNIFDDMEDDGC
jgi:hypothetical protein